MPQKNLQAYDWLESAIAAIHRAHWYRSPQEISSKPSPEVQIGDRSMLMFASNNYLGLAGDQRLIEAAIAATQTYGTGTTGSRLVSGHLHLHSQLEQAIANFKQTEAALVFSSGYLANLGTLSAIAGSRDLILADAYNHACLKQGASLSGAKVMEFLHNNIADLSQKLQQQRHHHRRCVIATETVFSMDGDLCPLTEIMELADTYDCMVLVDEAHAVGVLGGGDKNWGGGLVEALGITQPLIQIGTLSKALGSQGGYVAGSAILIDYLRNRASTWIYTTGLAPANAAAALAAIAIIQAEPQLRRSLWTNVELLQSHLKNAGISTLPSNSAIIPVIVGDTSQTLAVAKYLQNQLIFAPAIRPPTVPSSRIRITLMATHTPAQIETLVNHLSAAIAQI